MDGQPAIRISGKIPGAITSQKEYDNYHLRVEFKWEEKNWRSNFRRDSGLAVPRTHQSLRILGRVKNRPIFVLAFSQIRRLNTFLDALATLVAFATADDRDGFVRRCTADGRSFSVGDPALPA